MFNNTRLPAGDVEVQTGHTHTQENLFDHTDWNFNEHYEFITKNFVFNALLVIAFSACVLAGLAFVFCRLYKHMEALRFYWIKDKNWARQFEAVSFQNTFEDV